MTTEMNRIVADKIEDLKQLCNTYKVKSMYVFGSVCTDKFNDNSDIDILIEIEENAKMGLVKFFRCN